MGKFGVYIFCCIIVPHIFGNTKIRLALIFDVVCWCGGDLLSEGRGVAAVV